MSALAKQISTMTTSGPRARRGPANVCGPLYGTGDYEDWEAVEAKRDEGMSWREVQAHIDDILGITKPISPDKFRYHWRRRCSCWPESLQL